MHPDVHVPWQTWSNEQVLHVACAYSNPCRFEKRRRLANNFIKHMQTSANVILHVGELAYGDRPWEITGNDPNDVQLRTQDELWHKENILNTVVQRFPHGWKYGAYLDMDFYMSRYDWALETIHQLQHYAYVQLFSSYAYLSSEYRPHNIMSGFAFDYINGREPIGLPVKNSDKFQETVNKPLYHSGQNDMFRSKSGRTFTGGPGGGWGFTRAGFETTGGLLDICILGSGDHYMALGYIGDFSIRAETQKNPSYHKAIVDWQLKAVNLKKNIGYVKNHGVHHFHGPMVNRSYGERWRILEVNDFDPGRDLRRNFQGIYELVGDKPQLRDDLRAYFRARNEDDPNLSERERHIV